MVMKMKQGELLNIQILPQADDPSFEQRESGMAHTSYREETAFLSAIQQGDVERVKQLLGQYIKSGIVVGRLSTNSIRQMQYWAVCCVTLGTRYAIQGGLNEMQAFNLSDRYIMQIDQFTSGEEIISFLNQIVLEITGLVHENARGNCPAAIRKCLDYIDRNLHESIRLADLAALVNLSGDYLSKLFKASRCGNILLSGSSKPQRRCCVGNAIRRWWPITWAFARRPILSPVSAKPMASRRTNMPPGLAEKQHAAAKASPRCFCGGFLFGTLKSIYNAVWLETIENAHNV